ncbi:hypothetical protein N7453_003644 [Penicillium expansum]|nr:hypothetical protein N7453_003644 [Penicillium expansum]
MSETSSLLPGESDGLGRRTLRDRIVDAFRSSPQTGLGISTSSSHDNQTAQESQPRIGVTREPDMRTRLLESYLQADPACEDVGRQSYIGGPGDAFGYNGHELVDGAVGHPGGVVDHPESVPDSETPSQMKSSFTFPITETNKQ